MQTLLDAPAILKLLRDGKKLLLAMPNKEAAMNMRGRIASMKSAEDKLLGCVELADGQSLLSHIFDVQGKIELSLQIANRKPVAQYFVTIMSDDELENG